jgi:hypothetical protein
MRGSMDCLASLAMTGWWPRITTPHCNHGQRVFRLVDFAYAELPTLSQAYTVARACCRDIVRRNRLIETG